MVTNDDRSVFSEDETMVDDGVGVRNLLTRCLKKIILRTTQCFFRRRVENFDVIVSDESSQFVNYC